MPTPRPPNFTQEDIEKSLEIVKALYDNNVCAPASYSSAYSNDDLQSDPNWIAGKYVCSFAYISTMNVMTAANTNATTLTGTLTHHGSAKNDGWSCNCPQFWQLPPPARTPRQP